MQHPVHDHHPPLHIYVHVAGRQGNRPKDRATDPWFSDKGVAPSSSLPVEHEEKACVAALRLSMVPRCEWGEGQEQDIVA